MTTPRFDPEHALEVMHAQEVTSIIAVPTMVEMLFEAGLERHRPPALRLLLCGGARSKPSWRACMAVPEPSRPFDRSVARCAVARRPWFRAVLVLLPSGCTVGAIDRDDRPCPCIDGYRCTEAMICVPLSDPIDGGGGDAAPEDGGAADARVVDGGMPDLSVDGGRLDGCEASIGRAVLFCDDFETP